MSNKQHEVVVGLLMGDGNIEENGNYARLRAEMISENYLEYLDDVFGVFSRGVSDGRSAEKLASYHGADPKNYNDSYVWATGNHPELTQYLSWYESGNKVYPNITLTPTILKHWYVGDGTYDNSASHDRIKIGLKNEIENKKNIEKMFEEVGFEVGFWTEDSIYFSKQESSNLFEYMGNPLPDFGYKWPERFITDTTQ